MFQGEPGLNEASQFVGWHGRTKTIQTNNGLTQLNLRRNWVKSRIDMNCNWINPKVNKRRCTSVKLGSRCINMNQADITDRCTNIDSNIGH